MSFNIGTGFNNTVRVINIQPDGKILVGGDFTTYNGTTRNRIVRLNSNGSIDTSFNIGTGFNGIVITIDIQQDGKILVGGNFNLYNNTTSNNIIRLNSNGSIDTSFNIGTGFNDEIWTIDIQPDGKILVGGDFTTYNGTTRNRIVRLNSNGSIDTSFTTGGGFDNGTVIKMCIQPDGRILAGGGFNTYNWTTSIKFVRIYNNGHMDTSFNIGTGFSIGTFVYAIELQPDGKILVGGTFNTYDGTTRNRIIRLNSNGSIDTSFNIGTGFNSDTVYTIGIQPDGKILVGGSFITYNGTPRNRIIRLNSNGSIDTSFNIGTGFNGYVNTIDIQQDGKILVGGTFTTYNGTTSNRIIRLNSNGSIGEDIPIVITDPLRLATFEWLNEQEWLTKKGGLLSITKKAVTKTELIQYYNVNQTLVADITSDRNVIRDRVRPSGSAKG